MTQPLPTDDRADAAEVHARDGDERFDVLVVGGGVAGLAAALTLGIARRRVLVVDAGEPRNAPTAHVHGFLTRDGDAPADVLRRGREEVRRYGNEVVAGSVESVERAAGGGYLASTADGLTWRARRVLVAAGLVDELPDIPGVAERWGRDVIHCPYCFGWELRDRPIGVLGTRAGAYGQALHWRQWSDDVLMFQHTAPPPDDEDAARLEARGIRVVPGEVVAVEHDGTGVQGIRLRGGAFVPCAALVVPTVVRGRSSMLAALGAEVVEHPSGVGTSLATDEHGRTSDHGVWVAGNAADVMAGVFQSAASGTTAGGGLNTDLTDEDTRLAVDAARDR